MFKYNDCKNKNNSLLYTTQEKVNKVLKKFGNWKNIFNFKYKFIFLELVAAHTRVFYNKKDMALFLNKNHIFSKYFIYILRIKHIIENSICYSKQ